MVKICYSEFLQLNFVTCNNLYYIHYRKIFTRLFLFTLESVTLKHYPYNIIPYDDDEENDGFLNVESVRSFFVTTYSYDKS